MTPNRIFVDSSFFKAVIDEDDDFYNKAMSQLLKLQKDLSDLVTTNFILDESYTLIRVKCSLVKAIRFREFLSQGLENLRIDRVELKDEVEAWGWFVNKWGRKLSFTDCTSFAVMQRLGLEEVLTFDEHFAKAGFKIFK